MDLDLNGRRAIVTGGSRGIGRAVVEALASEGCTVAFCARGAEGVSEAQGTLQAAGHRVRGSAVDVGDADAYRSWLGEAIDELGGLDILVCNTTGYARPGEDGWRRTLEIDLFGLVRAVEVARSALEASEAGSVVALGSSTAVDIFLPGGESYGALKSALIHHAGVLARDLGATGVRCNVVSPGPIEFEGNVWRKRHDAGDALYENLRARTPAKRMGAPEEVARAVVFLASPAAAWVNGTNLIVDGGLTTRIDY